MATDTISMNVPGIDSGLAFRESRLPGNAQAGASYTAELADVEKVVRMNSSGASTFTVPADASVPFPIGTVLTVARDGAGAVAIAAAAGVTINRDAGTTAAIATQFGLANIRKTAANTWSLFGALVLA